MDNRDLAYWAVHRGLQMGATAIEAFFLEDNSLSVTVRHGQVETIKQAQEKGVGFRVIVGGRLGFAYTSDLRKAFLEDSLLQAIANASKTSIDENNLLPKAAAPQSSVQIYDPTIAETKIEDKINLAKAMEDAAFAYDPRIVRTEQAAYEDTIYEVTIVNSNGMDVNYQGAFCGGYIWVVAEENGDNQTGTGMDFCLNLGDLKPQGIGKEAGEQAVSLLGAKMVSSQKVTIVMSPRVATQFLGVLAPALSADAVQKGRSLLAGQLGQKVASALITLVDDGALTGGINSSPVDGEGVPTKRNILLDGGKLNTYLYNTYTANRAGTISTGNASRHSFRGTPEIGTSNLYIEPGKHSEEEILQGISQGFYVTEVLGMHTANPISGDFSVGAAGIWIEEGKLTYPVRGVAIAGNILGLFKNIEALGSNLRFYLGTGSPSIRFKPIQVSGK